jgi:hypothetical protein
MFRWDGVPPGQGERKVRAPQDRVVGNTDRPQGPGKCNRKIPPRPRRKARAW